MPRKSNVFRLTGAHRDGENRELLERLLQQEKDGKLVGLIVVTLCRDRREKHYVLSTAGWANDSPTLALGALTSCRALLEAKALQEAGLL